MRDEMRHVVIPVLKALNAMGFLVVAAPGKEPMRFTAALQVLRQHRRSPGIVWRANTGAAVMEGQMTRSTAPYSHVTVERRFIRYGVPGMADIGGILAGGRVLAIECKEPGCKLRPEQEAYLASVEEFGGVAFVARSADDVIQRSAVLWRGREDERS